MAAYEEDMRFRQLFEFIDHAARCMKSEYTHKLSKEDERRVEEAKRQLMHIGLQMEQVYTSQPSLLPEIPTKKVVQQEWNRRRTNRSGKASKSGRLPTDPLRS